MRVPNSANVGSSTSRSTAVTSQQQPACGNGSAWTAWWWSISCAVATTTQLWNWLARVALRWALWTLGPLLRSEHYRIPFRSYLLWCPNSHWRSQDKINLLLANLNLLALQCLRRPEGWCFWQEFPGVSDMPMGRYCCFLAPDQWPLFIVTATRHWIPSLCMATRVYHWTHGLPHFLSCYFL